MKPSRSILSPLAATLLALSGTALAQTATTDPVGFITLNVTAGSVAHPVLSLDGLGLTPPVDFQGTADSVGTKTLTINSAPFVANRYNATAGVPIVPVYSIEMTSGAGAGVILDIASNTATTITTVQTLPSGAGSFKVRPHWTINSIFGATNSAGLGGGLLASADQILIQNGNGYDFYYYQVDPDGSNGGTGWRSTNDSFTDAGPTVILPEEGLFIKCKQAAGAKIVLTGAVKTLQTSVPVMPGNNILGNICATPMTLADSGLYDAAKPANSVQGGLLASADQILLLNAGGTGYTFYYYQIDPDGSNGGTGWRSTDDSFTDVGLTAKIPVGSGVIIKRKAATAFSWIIPQHPQTL